MTPLTPILTDGAFLVDNSFMETFTTCTRKTQYRYLSTRTKLGEKSALNFGSAVHLAMDYRYSVCQNRQVTEEDEQIIHDELLVPFFEQNPVPEGEHRTLNWCFEIIKHYNRNFVVEPFKLISWKEPRKCNHCEGRGEVNSRKCVICNGQGKKSIMSEITFCHDLCTIPYNGIQVPIKYIGRIDLPVIWDDILIVLDHKTTSLLGEFYFAGQRVSPQYEGYCWAMQKVIDSPLVGGFCVNGIRTKEAPGKPKSGWDVWWSECFERDKQYLRPTQLKEWEENTIELLYEWFWHYGRGYFPMKKKACTMYGKCAYYDICSIPKENRELALHDPTQFQEDKWSPLKDVSKT